MARKYAAPVFRGGAGTLALRRPLAAGEESRNARPGESSKSDGMNGQNEQKFGYL